MAEQQHQSDPRIFDRRTLWTDHRSLVDLLAPGMSVLDVGCGTGSITRGIAEAVGPGGDVVGIDRDGGLLEHARVHGAGLRNLRFEAGDATRLDYASRFDVVTTARTLQWIADPGSAVRHMARAARPGGWLVVLDYNHVFNAWDPAPPPAFAAFYAAFLAWRASNGWDNEVANHCPALCAAAGLQDIRRSVQDEISVRSDADFDGRTSLWVDVIDNIGPTLAMARACDAALLESARRAFEAWRATQLQRQTLSMCAIVARVPER
jgi:SAM-dependent methyltransferase